MRLALVFLVSIFTSISFQAEASCTGNPKRNAMVTAWAKQALGVKGSYSDQEKCSPSQCRNLLREAMFIDSQTRMDEGVLCSWIEANASIPALEMDSEQVMAWAWDNVDLRKAARRTVDPYKFYGGLSTAAQEAVAGDVNPNRECDYCQMPGLRRVKLGGDYKNLSVALNEAERRFAIAEGTAIDAFGIKVSPKQAELLDKLGLPETLAAKRAENRARAETDAFWNELEEISCFDKEKIPPPLKLAWTEQKSGGGNSCIMDNGHGDLLACHKMYLKGKEIICDRFNTLYNINQSPLPQITCVGNDTVVQQRWKAHSQTKSERYAGRKLVLSRKPSRVDTTSYVSDIVGYDFAHVGSGSGQQAPRVEKHIKLDYDGRAYKWTNGFGDWFDTSSEKGLEFSGNELYSPVSEYANCCNPQMEPTEYCKKHMNQPDVVSRLRPKAISHQ